MATQAMTAQSGVAIRGSVQGVDGRLASFISTAKELLGVYFSTRGTINHSDPANRARLTVRETTESDANVLGLWTN